MSASLNWFQTQSVRDSVQIISRYVVYNIKNNLPYGKSTKHTLLRYWHNEVLQNESFECSPLHCLGRENKKSSWNKYFNGSIRQKVYNLIYALRLHAIATDLCAAFRIQSFYDHILLQFENFLFNDYSIIGCSI